MKKIIVIAIVLGILGIMYATVPSPNEHRELLKEKVYQRIEENHGGNNALVRWFQKKVSDVIIKRISIKDCVFFNLGYIPDDESNMYVSVGVFNTVIITPTGNDIIDASLEDK